MKKWVRNLIIIIVVLIVLNYIWAGQEEKQKAWEKNNCELTFNTHTYNTGCASACSSKCFNEGFPNTDAGFFEPYLSVEEMADTDLYKRCECNCGGCR